MVDHTGSSPKPTQASRTASELNGKIVPARKDRQEHTKISPVGQKLKKYIHKLNKHNANQITRTVIKVIRVNLLKVSENKCPPINTIGIIAKGSNALI